MIYICRLLWCALVVLFRSRASLESEIMVLRHQLNVLRRRSPKRLIFSDIERFDRLFAFLVVGHGRRQSLWFDVTQHPTAEWMAQKITEAFPWASAPGYLVRDNDRAYGQVFTAHVRAMGIRDQPISPGSQCQIGVAERFIGALRRNCLDQFVIFGKVHLRRVLAEYADYYNRTRTHRTLQKDAPYGRAAAGW